VTSCPYGAPRWVCRPGDQCFRCATDRHDRAHPEPVVDCLSCKLATIQVHRQVGADTRERRVAPIGNKGGNEWERGIVRDARGLPLLDTDGSVISVKTYADRRGELEAKRRALHQRSDP
jgi:hypothetical protein